MQKIKNFIQKQTVNLFNMFKNSGDVKLVYWSISFYIAYLCSSLFLFITPSIDNIDIGISLLLFVIFTFSSYFLIKILIKKELTTKNSYLKPYAVFSYILLGSVIITFILSVYYLNLWFQASVFEDKYMVNYDLKVKNITIVFLSVSILMGSFIFFLIKSRKTIKINLVSSAILTFKLLLKMLLVFVLDLFIGAIIYTIINISGDFPFG